ncbi:RimJ/RimL family protein N-acetyltransferase [Novosphingobium sp. PhB165]|uniref:GNAT family N-acetyltransferase n=1 Tax=Novosphingobium sp. PhB165 TaxID=2485105 RepID=UPI00104EFA64|nr:GNAT family N-acetyltransferase [Novosphingobium sp. PhB165]TCM18596.1 RimJ/RimL family protein N-acetyltransferase [Novosphingobium sp. PhB165]
MSAGEENRPFLKTKRFELWKPAAGDLDGLCRLIADEDMRRFLGPASPDPMEQFNRLGRNAGSWALYGYGSLYVRRPGEADLLANCGVFHSWRGFGKGMDDTPEAGWIVRKDCWGEGLAQEVMHTVIAWFDKTHGPKRIACMIEEGNIASERVAARLGFMRYGRHEPEDERGAAVNLFERISSNTTT